MYDTQHLFLAVYPGNMNWENADTELTGAATLNPDKTSHAYLSRTYAFGCNGAWSNASLSQLNGRAPP